MRRILALLTFSIFVQLTALAQSSFVTLWDTRISGNTAAGPQSNNTTLRLPVLGTGSFQVTLERVEPTPAPSFEITADGTSFPVITGLIPGTYRVSIQPGNFTRFLGGLSNNDDPLKLLFIESWGSIKWVNMHFLDSRNMDMIATDLPDLSECLYLNGTFSGCINMVGNSSFENWDVSNIRDLSATFQFAEKFNQDISGWDLSNVYTISVLFSGAKAFNQNISGWNVSGVTDMSGTFQNALSFNQPIGNWNTGNATNMMGMFSHASTFNQPLNWNTSKVTNISWMFRGATAFNQNLGHWNLSSVTTANNMFQASGLDCNNYSNTLIGWAGAVTTPNNIPLGSAEQPGSAPRSYGSAATASRATLTGTKGWTIAGDVLDANCNVSLPITMGGVSATHTNGILTVNWQTINETNNRHFIVQASANGDTWTDLGTVSTKANNGTSNSVLNYNFTKSISGMALVAFSLLSLLLLPSFKSKAPRWTVAIGVMICLMACSKTRDSLEENAEKNLFVRIMQVDSDGKQSYSTAVKAIRK